MSNVWVWSLIGYVALGVVVFTYILYLESKESDISVEEFIALLSFCLYLWPFALVFYLKEKVDWNKSLIRKRGNTQVSRTRWEAAMQDWDTQIMTGRKAKEAPQPGQGVLVEQGEVLRTKDVPVDRPHRRIDISA